MNEKCKYCDYVSKCSKKCEYGSILCTVNRSFPKIVDKSYEELQQENQQLKSKLKQRDEVIEEAIDYIRNKCSLDFKLVYLINKDLSGKVGYDFKKIQRRSQMNKEELYSLALSDINKYSLLNEIFAIRVRSSERVNNTIGVTGYISVNSLNQYITKVDKNTKYKQALIDIRKISSECKMLMPHEFDWEEQINNILQIIDKALGGSDEN